MRGIISAARTQAATSAAQTQAQSASHAVSEMQVKNLNITVDIDKLFLITHALWELLKKEHGYTDDVLTQKVAEIDMSTGKLDGKAPKIERSNCSACARKLGRNPTCMYCGMVNIRSPFER